MALNELLPANKKWLPYKGERATNYEDKCPVAIVLDTSWSMRGEPIHNLNMGVKNLKEDIMNDPIASKRIELLIVSFSGKIKVINDFSPPEKVEIPELKAGGATRLVDGVREGITRIEARKNWYKEENGVGYYRPFIILLTDGSPYPKQDLKGLKSEIDQGVNEKRFRFWAFGTKGANMAKLTELSHPEFPPQKLRAHQLINFFDWLSNSMKTFANSRQNESINIEPHRDQNPFCIDP